MEKNSTRFLNYYQIDTSSLDLFADAFGFEYRLNEILAGFICTCKKPDDKVVGKLFRNIDQVIDKY